MLTTENRGEELTADLIVSEILQWDKPGNIQENLQLMFEYFYMHGEGCSKEVKESVFYTFKILNEAVGKMGKIES